MIRRLILSLILAVTVAMASAQSSSLSVSRIFAGQVVPLERMVVTKVRGRTLSPYRLSCYHSARFTCSYDEAQECLTAVNKDVKKAKDDSLTRKVKADGQKMLSVTFMLDPVGKTNRFISYLREKRGKNRYEVTIIYMEGTVSGLKELEKLVK